MNKESGFAFFILIALIVIVAAGYLVWTRPFSESDIQHHNANKNPYLPLRAYDSGADFYAFNRCSMFLVVDGKKFSFAGDEQNDECTWANPGDALKAMTFVRDDGN